MDTKVRLIVNLDNFCQICVMPKDSDMFIASTEKDGSVNGEYCSYCYDAGEFSMSDSIKTASDMQEMVKNQLKKNV